MAKIALHLPPLTAKTFALKGASFITSADSKGAHVSLDTDSSKRRSQTLLLGQAIEAFGPVKSVDWAPHFLREGKRVILKLLNYASHPSIKDPHPGLFTHSPAMLRAYLALLSSTDAPYQFNPQDAHDIAHLLWIMREKGGIVPFGWALGNGTKPPAPADASDLTPVFTGAKLGVWQNNRIW